MDILDLIIVGLDGLVISTMQDVLPLCSAQNLIDRVTGEERGPFPQFVDNDGNILEAELRNGRLSVPAEAISVMLTHNERAEINVAKARGMTGSIKRYVRIGCDRASAWHREQQLGGVQPLWRPVGSPTDPPASSYPVRPQEPVIHTYGTPSKCGNCTKTYLDSVIAEVRLDATHRAWLCGHCRIRLAA